MYYSTKNYPPSLGLSCVFRQWRAESHCRFLHGYALGFRFKFAAAYLDANGWVMDFGGLKPLKESLVERYDHRLLVAQDDPQLETIMQLSINDTARIITVPKVGVEAFATQAFWEAARLCNNGRVRVISCECYEHEGNSAIYAEERT
jgi:6-pyruvoyltetrahydropterin/6-carboxytetrahydropterin synthase